MAGGVAVALSESLLFLGVWVAVFAAFEEGVAVDVGEAAWAVDSVCPI